MKRYLDAVGFSFAAVLVVAVVTWACISMLTVPAGAQTRFRPAQAECFTAGPSVYMAAPGSNTLQLSRLSCVALDPATLALNPTTGKLQAIIPASSSVPQFVDSETPQGAVDGANATFNLMQGPNPPGSLLLFRNGILQCAIQCASGPDYTLVGNTITFVTEAIPQATGAPDTLKASYRFR